MPNPAKKPTMHGVVDGVEQPSRSADGSAMMVAVAFTGSRGFRISKPPEDPASEEQASFFRVPQIGWDYIQYALVDAHKPRQILIDGANVNVFPCEHLGLVATQDENGLEEHQNKYRNRYFPELIFQPHRITMVEKTIADKICNTQSTGGLFQLVDRATDGRFDNWELAGSELSPDEAPTPRRRGGAKNSTGGRAADENQEGTTSATTETTQP